MSRLSSCAFNTINLVKACLPVNITGCLALTGNAAFSRRPSTRSKLSEATHGRKFRNVFSSFKRRVESGSLALLLKRSIILSN